MPPCQVTEHVDATQPKFGRCDVITLLHAIHAGPKGNVMRIEAGKGRDMRRLGSSCRRPLKVQDEDHHAQIKGQGRESGRLSYQPRVGPASTTL